MRQTGKTTRVLLRALVLASEGEKVVVCSPHGFKGAAWLSAKAERMADYAFEPRGPLALFCAGGGGAILFKSSGSLSIERIRLEHPRCVLLIDPDED